MSKIPTAPSPTLKDADQYSSAFNDFLRKCLDKDPTKRPTARELLQHPFIAKSKGKSVLLDLVDAAMKHFSEHGHMVLYICMYVFYVQNGGSDDDDEDSDNERTMAKPTAPKKEEDTEAAGDDDDDDLGDGYGTVCIKPGSKD